MKILLRSSCRTVGLLLVIVACTANSPAYSVLTHEELIDLAWNDSIRPFLLARFPNSTEQQLVEAHAYAYGGCAIQDMGYYPFGKPFFSNLTHYVRTGDFIAWMLQNAHNLDELAFAVGALSHYLGDSIGHSEAINPSTAINFPKLKDKFGASVTYGESPHGHIRTEFAFDIDELTDAAFAPPAYLHFIGFKVPRKYLEQAFVTTYGFDIHEIVGRAHPALRSYDASVRRFIPLFAEGEVVLHRHHFSPHPNDEAFREFKERVARTNYDRRWKHTYRNPGFKAHLVAALIFIIPKIGAASDLAIKIPTPDTEEKYLRSVNRTVDVFHETLQKLQDGATPPVLANLDLDTGNGAKLGDYPLADQAYSSLLDRLTARPRRVVPAGLKQNVIDYFANLETVTDSQVRLHEQLAKLKEMKTK